MSDTVFEAGPPSGLAWLRPRSISLFGGETDAVLAPASAAKPLDVSDDGRLRPGYRFAGPALKAVLGATALCAAVALAAFAVQHVPVATPRLPAPPIAAWRDIIKPVRIFSLESPAFAGLPVGYSARRHTIGGGREDVLLLGALNGDKPGLRLRIFRRGAELPGVVPLFAALAHEAAQGGLSVARSGLPELLPTRFGRFEFADISLARRDGAAAPCGGFRLALESPALSVVGLACGGRTMRLSKADIGCLIERLDVASARDDRDLIDFFAKSELRRNIGCTGMRLGPDSLHAPWLDDKPAPVMQPNINEHAKGKPATARKRLRRR